MKIVYAPNLPPDFLDRSLFLVGPTPRIETGGESWRPAMIRALEKAGYDGVVYVPETEDGQWKHSYTDQIEWEQRYLSQADAVAAWVPRDLKTMPGFTTNFEIGQLVGSGRLVYGCPPDAPKTQYLHAMYVRETGEAPCHDLAEMAREVVARTSEPYRRVGGEQAVPASIWRTPAFRGWYADLREAGNVLEDAKLLWSFRVGPKRDVTFCFALWAKIWIKAEDRRKENEFVFGRPDISTIVAFRRGSSYPSFRDSEFVLVKEFRTPGRARDGFVHELPGGSSFKGVEDPLQLASEELEEETSLRIDPSRFKVVNARQVAPTLSTHRAHVFSVELKEEEMSRAKEIAKSGQTHGVAEDSERTYVEVASLSEILKQQLLGWADVGMLLEVIQGLHREMRR